LKPRAAGEAHAGLAGRRGVARAALDQQEAQGGRTAWLLPLPSHRAAAGSAWLLGAPPVGVHPPQKQAAFAPQAAFGSAARSSRLTNASPRLGVRGGGVCKPGKAPGATIRNISFPDGTL
jgi:hypothetical protein